MDKSLVAGRNDYVVDRNEQLNDTLRWRDDSTGTPVDLTGYDVTVAVGPGGDFPVYVRKTTALEDGPSGLVPITLTVEEIELLDDGANFYDVQLTGEGKAPIYFVQGLIHVVRRLK